MNNNNKYKNLPEAIVAKTTHKRKNAYKDSFIRKPIMNLQNQTCIETNNEFIVIKDCRRFLQD